MKTRVKLLSIFQKFHAKIRSQVNTLIRILRCDMPRNIFLDHSRPLCPHMGFFISLLVLTRLNRREWLSARTVIWLKPLALSYSIICFTGSNPLFHPFSKPIPFLPSSSCLWLCMFCLYSYSWTKQALKQSHEVSSSVIPDFNEVIVATLLIHIDTLSLPMSLFLRTLQRFLPPSLPVLMSYLYPFSISSRIPHLYLRLLHLDHCRFILIACVLVPPVDSPPMEPSSSTPVLPSPTDLPIVIRKGTRSSRNLHPIYNFLSYQFLSSQYSTFISTVSSVSLPKIVHEALSHPCWKQAMVEEMATLHSTGTWDLVTLPVGKSPVGCR